MLLYRHTQSYLWPKVLEVLHEQRQSRGNGRVFELGCGNGAFVAELIAQGFDPVGVDPSISGIDIGRKAHANAQLHVGSAYDKLSEQFGRFPLVVSLEVVEHVYAPRDMVRTVFQLLEPGGVAVLSTPYHGYWKNLALAATGKMDSHFTALWDHGHIKFWSVRTLSELLTEAGFGSISFRFAGRNRLFAKSMIAIARRPAS